MKKLTPEDNDRINKEVICETRKQFEKAGFKVPKIAEELALIAFSDISDFVEVDEVGIVRAIAFDELKKNKSRTIKKIREKRVIRTEKGTKDNPDGEQILDSTFEFELYDKLEALGMAIEIIGIKKPKEVKLNGSLNINTTGAKQKLLDRIDAIARAKAKRKGVKRSKR